VQTSIDLPRTSLARQIRASSRTMPAPADIHYARTSDGIDIAYTEFGEGPDLLIAPGFVTHLDLMWDFPTFSAFLGLARSFRVIVFDKRGTGLSDRSLGFGSLEDRTGDIRAVLDKVGSERAILYGISESGPMCTYYAASHPERVAALILYGTLHRFDPGMGIASSEFGVGADGVGSFIDWIATNWGQGDVYSRFMSKAPDPVSAKRVFARYERSACTPQMSREIMTRNLEMNVEPLLASISVPTLVLHCSGDPIVPVGYGRALAAGIPGAKFVDVDADFHGSWLREDTDKLSGPLLEFLMGLLGKRDASERAPAEREIATVMFTDIVRSTERASELGDAAWRALLDAYETSAALVVGNAGGRLIKTTGDGLLATFKGPSHAVAAGRALQDAALPLGVSVRAGLHTGEIERRGEDIGGIGVHIAARVCSLAGAGEIFTTRTSRDLALGSQLVFEERGTHTLKGVREQSEVFLVQ